MYNACTYIFGARKGVALALATARIKRKIAVEARAVARGVVSSE